MKTPASTAVLLLALALPAVAANQVWTVDDNGPADFATLPAAVAAAGDGDVLLVRDGFYSNLALMGKALTLVAEPLGQSGEHQIAGVRITDLPAGKTVTLRGFRLVRNPFDFTSESAVHLENNAGTVVLEDCLVTPENSPTSGTLRAIDSAAVFVTRSQVIGNNGVTPFIVPPLPPRSAILASGSNLYVHRSTLVGGTAAPGLFPSEFSPGGPGQDGAPAVHLTDGRLLVAGGTVTGGKGGNNASNGTDCIGAGDGGPAIAMLGTHPRLVLLADTSLVGGLPGNAAGPCSSGAPGPQLDQQAGFVTQVPDVSHGVQLSSLVQEGNDATFTLDGEPGSIVKLLLSVDVASGLWVNNLKGALLVDLPFALFVLGELPPSGELEFPLTIPPSLPPSIQGIPVFAQTLIGTGNGPLLGAGTVMTLVQAEP